MEKCVTARTNDFAFFLGATRHIGRSHLFAIAAVDAGP